MEENVSYPTMYNGINAHLRQWNKSRIQLSRVSEFVHGFVIISRFQNSINDANLAIRIDFINFKFIKKHETKLFRHVFFTKDSINHTNQPTQNSNRLHMLK